jgi:hypothetical protein
MARPPLSLHSDVAAATRERSWLSTPIASPCTFFDLEGNFEEIYATFNTFFDLEGNFEEVYATFNTFFYLSSLPPPSAPRPYSTLALSRST